MKKLLLVLLALGIIPLSCYYEGPQQIIRITNLGNEIGTVNGMVEFTPLIPKSMEGIDSIKSNNFGISVSILDYDVIKEIAGLNLTHRALADQPTPRTEKGFKEINIFFSADVIVNNQTLSAGENLNHIFLASFEYGSIFSISDFIDTIGYWYISRDLILHFDGTISNAEIGHFDIQIILEDGSTFDLQTEEFALVP